MSEPQQSLDFARRVAHFDVVESDRSDDDDDAPKHSKARTTDDIEKEYLIGGGADTTDDTDDVVPVEENSGSCTSCGGSEKAGRVEGRNLVLASMIISMVVGGMLVYSSWTQMDHPNRKVVCIVGFALGCYAELVGVIGLIGLCRFSDIDKIPFKLGFWLNLIQLWALTGYAALLLFTWDGNYKSGTLPLTTTSTASSSSSSSDLTSVTTTTTTSTDSGVSASAKASAAFTEVDAETTAFVEFGAMAPASGGNGSKAWQQFNSLLGTQLWFIGMVAVQLLMSVLYTYGSLRLRCKKMGKWGTAMTAFLLSVVSVAIMTLSGFTLKYNPSLITVGDLTPLAVEMAVAALIFGTAVYEFYVSTQVQKLKLAVKPNFRTLMILTLVSGLAISVSYYVYFVSLQKTPRIDLLHLTALMGAAAQLLLVAFGVMLLAWYRALPAEYPVLPGMEKFVGADAEETDAFIPPPPYQPYAQPQEI